MTLDLHGPISLPIKAKPRLCHRLTA